MVALVIYHLTPVFLRFKLHRTELQGLRRVNSLRRNLLMREIKQHRRNIYQMETTYLQKRKDFEQDMGLISRLYVRRFLRACEKDEFDQAASKHKQKLCRLGLNWQNIENNLNVVTNLSSKKLGNCEIDLLNKRLDFVFLPGKFNFLQVRANLEKF